MQFDVNVSLLIFNCRWSPPNCAVCG